MKVSVLILLVLCISGTAMAWGADGHRIIAQIAQDFLTTTAWSNIQTLLPPGYDLADIATWPDDYDQTDAGSWSEPLHYVDIPSYGLYYEPAFCPDNMCVVGGIANYTNICNSEWNTGTSEFCTDYGYSNLTSHSVVPAPCPLSFLVHLTGDCHQPLHVGYSTDAGGNEFYVDWYDQQNEALHHCWDSLFIYKIEDDLDLDWPDVAEKMVGYLDDYPALVSDYQSQMNASIWADESFQHARKNCYNFPPATSSYTCLHLDICTDTQWKAGENNYIQLNDPYYFRNVGIVFKRLSQAGTRLAYTLNSIYG